MKLNNNGGRKALPAGPVLLPSFFRSVFVTNKWIITPPKKKKKKKEAEIPLSPLPLRFFSHAAALLLLLRGHRWGRGGEPSSQVEGQSTNTGESPSCVHLHYTLLYFYLAHPLEEEEEEEEGSPAAAAAAASPEEE